MRARWCRWVRWAAAAPPVPARHPRGRRVWGQRPGQPHAAPISWARPGGGSAPAAAGRIGRPHERVHQGPARRRGQEGQAAGRSRPADRRPRARDAGPERRRAGPQDGGVQGAPRPGRDPRRPARGVLRRRPRGRLAGAGPAPLRRAAHGRHGAALRLDRRNEDRRGQDARLHPARLPQRPRRARRAHGDGQRVPGHPRLRVDGPGPPLARPDGRPHRLRHRRPRRQAGRLRRGHHVRHEQRVRLRLPARQHDAQPGAHGPARPRLRHRRRGRLHPHRRGAHAPHHLGPGRRGGAALLPVRLHRPDAHP